MSKWADAFEESFKDIRSLKEKTRQFINEKGMKIRKNIKKDHEVYFYLKKHGMVDINVETNIKNIMKGL